MHAIYNAQCQMVKQLQILTACALNLKCGLDCDVAMVIQAVCICLC